MANRGPAFSQYPGYAKTSMNVVRTELFSQNGNTPMLSDSNILFTSS